VTRSTNVVVARSAAFVGAIRFNSFTKYSRFQLEGVQRQKGYFHDVFHDTRLFGRLASDPL